MASFKCKMCGGSLEIAAGTTVIECEYCGTQQTLPKLDDDKRANMYDRANHFRRNNEFDKAMGIYENILNEDNTDAEAYWSLVLCRYGIEYVEDPTSHKRIPTVNRAQFTSIFDDDNYKSALQYADSYQRTIYEAEAKAINEIQKGILAISQKEEPFDVFICYKESDNSGRRTPDSVLAQDLYYQLKQEGFKVFFARITLEDKLGSAYEPYIFAALNSAKVMVVLGTKPEFFNAVWVKNEWSRYLALIKQGQKKMLIPAYKDMDPYDLPEEFSHLQAQDMSKLGFMQDLIRGIKKIAKSDEPKATTVVKETVVSSTNSTVAPLLKRAFMFLEDEEWDSADEYCEKVLDQDPKNAQAYLGKLMAEQGVKKQDKLKDCDAPFDNSNNYQKALRFADEKLKSALTGYIDHINTRNNNSIYTRAKKWMSAATTEAVHETAATVYERAALEFESISAYKDSASLAKECLEKAKEEERKAEEEKNKCDTLFNEYKVAVQNEKSGEIKKAEANRHLTSLNKQQNTLVCLKNDWQSIEDELFSLNERLNSIQSEIAVLNNKKFTLGLFAIKQKKEIAEGIRVLEIEQQQTTHRITFTQKKKQGYSTLSEVDDVINSVTQQIKAQKQVIEKLSCVRSSQIIRNELSTFELGEKYLQRFDSLHSIEKGSYITLGSFRQDDTFKSKNIEWLVLDIKDEKALVVSKHALICQPYNEGNTDVTWATCTLRKWLNDQFFHHAFSAEEAAMIPSVTVSADKNPDYSTNPGNATQDKVFLLSITEANKYFSSNNARQCKPTEYAVSRNTYVDRKNGNCWWWLRSTSDHHQNGAACVHDDGNIVESGHRVDYGLNHINLAVRPALWIDLNS